MKRKKLITVRVSDTEKAHYDGLAEKKGKPLSELIRHLLEVESDRCES